MIPRSIWILKGSFFLCTVCSSITCGDVNYDYMPDSFVTWEEKRNNFTFDKKKEKYGQGKSK